MYSLRLHYYACLGITEPAGSKSLNNVKNAGLIKKAVNVKPSVGLSVLHSSV